MTHMTKLLPTQPPAPRRFARASLAVLGGALLLAWGLPLASPARADNPAQADSNDDEEMDLRASDAPDAPEAGDASESGRVRFLEGDVKIERDDDDRVDEGSLNSPVFPGDIVVTAHGRAEVQLSSGALVRLDENSRVTFLSLPEPGGSDQDTVLQVSEGSASIEVHGALSRNKDFRVDTPSASVYVLASGRYRIDVEGKYKKTRASAFRGVAEVVGDDGSVILRSGQRTFVGDNGEPESPRTFNTAAADEFDGWILDRSDHYRRVSADDDVGEDALPEPVRPYRSELSYYGEWVDIAPYGECWVPGSVSAGWRPYNNGYWSYGPGGNFWVSYDPWGWAPYHYGRWVFAGGRGWCWVPGGVFSGAWVSWFYGPSYFGWCPLDFWDFPCATRFGFVGFDFHCWNFVNYHNIYHRNVRRVIATPGVVRGDLGRGVVTRRAVPIRPRDVRDNRIAPPLILQKARNMKAVQVDINGERVAKRSFRDGEKELARQNPGMRRLSPGNGRRGPDAGRPSTSGRDAKGSQADRGSRDRGSRGQGREGSSTRERGTDPGRPRMHGPDRGGSDDRNRGHGGGHKPSQRSMSSDDLLPSRPRASSGLAERDPSSRGTRGDDHPEWDRPRRMPSQGPRSRPFSDDGPDTARPYVPRTMRGPQGASPQEGRSDRRLMDLFRESDRGQRGPQGGPRAMPQGRPQQSPRSSEGRSQPRASRPSPPPPPPSHHNEEKKKR